MKKLEEIAREISNPELREKTISVLQNPLPSHPEWEHEGLSLTESPASTTLHHSYSGGLIEHLVSVARICMAAADVLEELHGTGVNRDELLSAALLHDIMKPINYSEIGNGYDMSDMSKIMDHLLLATAELYRRGFPIGVIHAVAAHHGPGSPVKPQTIEAIVLYLADSFDAEMNNKVIESARRVTTARLKELGLGTDRMAAVFDQFSPFEIIAERQKGGQDAVRDLVRNALDV